MTTAYATQVAAEVVDELLRFARNRLIKAARPSIARRQQQLLEDMALEMAKDLAAYFERFAARALPVKKAASIKWDPEDDIDWSVEEEDLTSTFSRWYARVGTETYAIASEALGAEVSWDVNQRGVQNVLGQIGDRVKGINDTSRDALQRMVADATERGLSIEEMVRGVPDSPFGGLRELVAGWASTAEGGANSRAQTIALTETATAYSLASTAAYRDSGLIDEVEVLDGPDCGWTEHDDPDLADGSIRTLDEAEEYPISHPNCQRAFAPVAAR